MPVRYLCDSCGYRGVDQAAGSVEEVLCEQCGEPVLADHDADASSNSPDPNRTRTEQRPHDGVE
jgi:hypothetical protein